MPDSPSNIWVPDLFGLQWSVFNSYDRALLLSGGRLGAKCVDANTIIHCDGRLRRIASLEPDLGCGETRPSAHTVTSLDKAGFTQANINAIIRNPHIFGLNISTSGGYSVKASPWHPLWCFVDGNFDYKTSTEIKALVEMGRIVWLPLKKGCDDWSHTDLTKIQFPCANKFKKAVAAVHDRIAFAVQSGQCRSWNQIAAKANTHYRAVKSFFTNRRSVEQYEVVLNESLAYFLGVLIGDGCMTNAAMAKHRVLFATADYEIEASMREILREHFPKHRLHRVGGYNWQITSPKVNALIWHLGMNKYAHEKTVPDCILQSPKAIVRAFLQGLFDTDGTVGKGGYASYCSTSEPLAKDVQQLLLAFGIKASCHFRTNSHRGAWLVNAYGDDARCFFKTVGFRLLRKQALGASSRPLHHHESPMAYPPDIRKEIKRVYLSRHGRGATRGNLPRTNRSGGMAKLYGSRCSVSPAKLERVMVFSLSQNDPVLNQYYLDGKVFWEPVVKASVCDVDLYDLSVPKLHNFVGNGFVNHNSWAALHRIARHLWETPNARVAMFCKVLKNSKDAGAWKNLENYTLKQWIGSGIGMRFTTKNYDDKVGPKVDGTTRTPFFRVTNMHGGESECMLFSMANDSDAEATLKEREFSLIYFSELSNFYTRQVLSLGLMCLRMPYLDFKQQMWMADTNPSDEGETSWIYEAFYIEPGLDYDDYRTRQIKLGRPPMRESAFLSFKANSRVIEMSAKDNERLKPGQLEELEAQYAYDPGLYARYVEGKWVYGGGENALHFRRFLKPSHIVGNVEGQDEEEYEYANPSANCFELISGWDTGETNHAACIMEKRYYSQYLPKTKTTISRAYFTMIDELVSLHTEMSLEEFTTNFMDIIADLEEQSGKKFDLERAYSDLQAITQYSATADSFPAIQINASSLGRIVLVGVPKPRHSVRVRVQLLQQLLAFDRIKVSAHCYHTIKMLKELKKGKDRLNYVLQSDDNRHIFDCLTYALIMECAEELEAIPRFNTGHRAGLAICVR